MDELKQIEIETARIRLERERLEYEKALRRRERSDAATNFASSAADKTVQAAEQTATTAWVFLKFVATRIIWPATYWGLAATIIVGGIFLLNKL